MGLTLALRSAQAGYSVTVYEAAPEIGGLASAWKIGDVVWDKHYHVTLLSDSYTRGIVTEIGLGDEFDWVETRTGFYTGSKLYSMSNTVEFLKFPPLGLVGKLRLGGTIFYASRVKDWQRLERISVESWLTKLSGKATFEKIWKPLLNAKLGQAYTETSAAFIWATIQRLYAARNSGMKKEMFGYVRGGYSRVLSRFEEVLRDLKVDIRLNARISTVKRAADGSLSVSADESLSGDSALSERYDKVVLTCTPGVAANLVGQLTDAERANLGAVKYQGIVCASVLLKRSLSPYYVTNIIDKTPFTGIIEMSAMVNKDQLCGKALIYLPKYADAEDEIFGFSDDEIKELYLSELERMYPDFSRDDVLAFKISRVKQVFPVPVLNYSKSVPPKVTSVDNVFVVNSAHILNGTLNVNETVQLAENFYRDHLSPTGVKII